jgi:hypothetical protein
MNDALEDLWKAAGANAPYNLALGIVLFWRDHWKELGSPVGPEHGDGANVYQAFTRGIIRWGPAGPTIL